MENQNEEAELDQKIAAQLRRIYNDLLPKGALPVFWPVGAAIPTEHVAELEAERAKAGS